VKLFTPAVPVKLCVVEAEPVLSIRRVELEIAAALESKTLTFMPSRPSTEASATAPTVNVVEVDPDAIVAEPERVVISALPAAVTVLPFVSPIADQEKVVSDETAELAVIVNVTSLPSATFEADLVTVKVGEAVELMPLLLIETSELPAVEPEVGRVATPIDAANAESVLEDPVTPAVALPPKSYVKLLAPLIVTTAPLDKVNCTASAANFEDAIERPSTSWIVFAPLVSTIVTAAFAAIEFERI
jgi:hypothetical protein